MPTVRETIDAMTEHEAKDFVRCVVRVLYAEDNTDLAGVTEPVPTHVLSLDKPHNGATLRDLSILMGWFKLRPTDNEFF